MRQWSRSKRGFGRGRRSPVSATVKRSAGRANTPNHNPRPPSMRKLATAYAAA